MTAAAGPSGYIATGPLLWEGRQLKLGDPVPSGPALERQRESLLRSHRIVRRDDLEMRWVCEVPFTYDARQYTPGDLLPAIAPAWPQFPQLRDQGRVRRASDDELAAAGLEDATVGASTPAAPGAATSPPSVSKPRGRKKAKKAARRRGGKGHRRKASRSTSGRPRGRTGG